MAVARFVFIIPIIFICSSCGLHHDNTQQEQKMKDKYMKGDKRVIENLVRKLGSYRRIHVLTNAVKTFKGAEESVLNKEVTTELDNTSPFVESTTLGDLNITVPLDDNNRTKNEERFPLAEIHFDRVAFPYVICFWIVLASFAKIVFHLNEKLARIFPESCILIALGVIIGISIYYSTYENFHFNSNTFFIYLLPPIIVDAGYFMPNRAFFDNIGTILLFAVLGTLFNALLIGLSLWGLSENTGVGWIPLDLGLVQCLTFSSLLSAVDPVAVLAVFEEIQVQEMLYIVVFGESLLNDAVTVVLYNMFEMYTKIGIENIITQDIIYGILSFFIVSIVSVIIGLVFGLLTSFVTRFTHHVRVVEPLIVLTLGYMSYLTAEIFHYSGILASTFCAISMRKYVETNVSLDSSTSIKFFLRMMASVSETIIFILLGISTVTDKPFDWNTSFVLLALLFCLIYRTFGVFLLTFLANLRRVNKLSFVDQFVMSYGGLRGAIAFSLALVLPESEFPNKNLFLTTTLVVIYFTVFIQGSTIKPLVNLLKVKKADKHDPSLNEQFHTRFIDYVMHGIEIVSGNSGHHSLRGKYEYFDNKYLKPLLTRDKSSEDYQGQSIVRVFNRINEDEAVEYVRHHPLSMFSVNREKRAGTVTEVVINSNECDVISDTPVQLHTLDSNSLSYKTFSLDKIPSIVKTRKISVNLPANIELNGSRIRSYTTSPDIVLSKSLSKSSLIKDPPRKQTRFRKYSEGTQGTGIPLEIDTIQNGRRIEQNYKTDPEAKSRVKRIRKISFAGREYGSNRMLADIEEWRERLGSDEERRERDIDAAIAQDAQTMDVPELSSMNVYNDVDAAKAQDAHTIDVPDLSSRNDNGDVNSVIARDTHTVVVPELISSNSDKDKVYYRKNKVIVNMAKLEEQQGENEGKMETRF